VGAENINGAKSRSGHVEMVSELQRGKGLTAVMDRLFEGEKQSLLRVLTNSIRKK
jgi:hypothetical protein